MKVDMSNLYMEDTGIPGRVIISRKLIGQNMPQLKYYCVYDTEFSISIDNTPQVLIPKSLDGKVPAEYIGIVSWIILNRDDLLAYWAQDIDSVELSKMLNSAYQTIG